jgi:phospholipid/cholesterol/gamma-HCH transport system substrate-binding protein
MKNENKNSVILGIFVLIGIIILVLGIFTLGGQQKRFVPTIRLKAVFDDVSGLQPGNNVWFSGVKVGTVRKIRFYGDSQVEVEFTIEEKVRDFIRKDSKATLGSDGLIGNKIIVLFGGSQSIPVVEDGDQLDAEMPLDTDKMMETLQENNTNLVSITQDLKVLIGKIADGKGMLGSILIDSMVGVQFQHTMNNLELISVSSNQMASELNKFSRTLNQKGNFLNDLATDKEMYQDIKSTVNQLKSTSDNINKVAANFNDFSNQLNDKENTMGLLLHDKEFANRFKHTMVQLDSSSYNLNRGLEALEYTWPFRRGFKRRAKEMANPN